MQERAEKERVCKAQFAALWVHPRFVQLRKCVGFSVQLEEAQSQQVESHAGAFPNFS